MSSRKEEERNEKIIRGLMKLPPNRRCINCNSLGPQYVCTTFWTFVCTTCSGIHREFTHRVKSVSMAKFTSQEVEALQNGGNQRAKEIYLKGWDPQTQRFPDNSNPEKIRQFIKNAYEDKKYYAPKSSDKPPRHLQNSRSIEEETRRASSYHSYSQSPPYDFQYEEHRYGKHAPALSRKPGSDRGLYEGKISSFSSSSQLSDRNFDSQSPNRENDVGSPFSQNSRDVSTEDLQHYAGKYSVKPLHSQRTASAGSFGSFDSLSFKSVSSVGVAEVASGSERSMGSHHKEFSTSPSWQHPSISETPHGDSLFTSPNVPQTLPSVTSFGNRSHLPESTTTPPVDLFQHSPNLGAPTFGNHQILENSAASLHDLLTGMPSLGNGNSQGKAILPNEGWATFDSQAVSSFDKNASVGLPSSGSSLEPPVPWSSFEELASDKPSSEPSIGQEGPRIVQSISNPVSSQWPSLTEFSARGDSSLSPSVFNTNQQVIEVASNKMETQSWNAFEDFTEQLNSQSTRTSNEHLETQNPLVFDHHMEFGLPEDFTGQVTQNDSMISGSLRTSMPSHFKAPYEDLSMPVGGTYAIDHKTTNPFDLPYHSSLEPNDLSQFWDMSSLQTALPDAPMPASHSGDGLTQSWYIPSPVDPYVTSGPQGPLGFMSAPAPSAQIPNVHLQGPVASIGGNPFA